MRKQQYTQEKEETMYFVGIDISKFKHDCAVIDETGETHGNQFCKIGAKEIKRDFFVVSRKQSA